MKLKHFSFSGKNLLNSFLGGDVTSFGSVHQKCIGYLLCARHWRDQGGQRVIHASELAAWWGRQVVYRQSHMQCMCYSLYAHKGYSCSEVRGGYLSQPKGVPEEFSKMSRTYFNKIRWYRLAGQREQAEQSKIAPKIVWYVQETVRS